MNPQAFPYRRPGWVGSRRCTRGPVCVVDRPGRLPTVDLTVLPGRHAMSGRARSCESWTDIRRDHRREIDPETTTAPLSPNRRAAKSKWSVRTQHNPSQAIERPRVSSGNANSRIEKSCLVLAAAREG